MLENRDPLTPLYIIYEPVEFNVPIEFESLRQRSPEDVFNIPTLVSTHDSLSTSPLTPLE